MSTIVKIMTFLAKVLKWDSVASTDYSETIYPDPVYTPSSVPSPLVSVASSTPVEAKNSPPEASRPPNPTIQPLLWNTPQNARHSVRVLCDNAGLTFAEKNLICAVIQGESMFYNTAKNVNIRPDGTKGSTDWGICQINDRFHIGEGKTFPSVEYVLQNPDKVVEWMIRMYRSGHLNWWCAYSNGSYKRYLA